jgi:hypothetical protein
MKLKYSLFYMSILFVILGWDLSLKADIVLLPTTPLYDDLWDISNGTTVTSCSSLGDSVANYVPEAIFGGTGGNWEQENIIFSDGYAPSYSHFIEWQTSTVVTIGAFNLTAGMDFPSPDGSDPAYARRSFAKIRLYAWDGSAFVKFFDETPSLPYSPTVGNDEMPFSVILPEKISASRWRVEFEQQVWTNAYEGIQAGYFGPRIVELDGFSIPEPLTLSFLVLGSMVILRRHKS